MSTEENSSEQSSKLFWKNLVIRYWVYVLIFGLIMIGAIIGFILTLDWYLVNASIGGQGTWTFNQFSMGTGVEWIIILFLWLLVIIGLPSSVLVGLIVGIIWFAVFDPELKEEIKLRSKREEEKKRRLGRTSESSGLFGFLMFIGVCLYIALDENWMTEFGNLNIGYFVNAWIAVFLWVVVLFSIGAVIGSIWFVIKYER